MSNEMMHVLITKMHIRLNKLIENNNYDLLSKEVQRYSRRLDRVLDYYSKRLNHLPIDIRDSNTGLKKAACN